MRSSLAFCLVLLSGCTNARYNIPYTETGLPDANTISRQIRCELIDLMRADGGYLHRGSLLQSGFVVAAALDLKVNSSGEIVPTGVFFGTDPIGLAIGARVSREVERTFNERLSFTSLDYANVTTRSPEYRPCLENKSRFGGNFGIKSIADLALTTEDRSVKDGFGGSFSLTVTRNLGGIGPRWIFNGGSDNFSILGSANSSQKNTITITFAQIDGTPTPARVEDASARAQSYLNTLLLERD